MDSWFVFRPFWSIYCTPWLLFKGKAFCLISPVPLLYPMSDVFALCCKLLNKLLVVPLLQKPGWCCRVSNSSKLRVSLLQSPEFELIPNIISAGFLIPICFPFNSGRIAALNMLKKRVGINSVPFFWTMLMGKSFRYAGRVSAGVFSSFLYGKPGSVLSCVCIAGYGEGHTEVIMKGKVEEMKFLAFYIKYSTISSFCFNQPKHKYY